VRVRGLRLSLQVMALVVSGRVGGRVCGGVLVGVWVGGCGWVGGWVGVGGTAVEACDSRLASATSTGLQWSVLTFTACR
jgi:hypothetical protein